GSTNFATSDSPSFTVTVNPIDTTTSLGSSNTTTVSGQSVTFTATVSAASGPAPTVGAVSFRDNGNEIGLITVDGSGVAIFTTSTLTVGSHPITAVYLGTSNFTTSNSNTVTQTVNAPAPSDTTTSLVTGGSPSSLGQSVTFTATVSSSGGAPTGTVTFII